MFKGLLFILGILLELSDESPAKNAKILTTYGANTTSPLVGLNVMELIAAHGYPIELHSNVTTHDGYLLDIHRVPHGKANTKQNNKPVALLVHGITSSASDWAAMGPTHSIIYILADLGYDVWIANARGTTWSRKHITLDPDTDTEYWKFSWHEMGIYDLPATIDYILERTMQEKLFYIGHSQGCTSFFVMTSERPEYNDKIALMTAFAPAVFVNNIELPLLRLAAYYIEELEDLLVRQLNIYELLRYPNLIHLVGPQMCRDESSLQELCVSLLNAALGTNPKQLNKTMLPIVLSNYPAGSSAMQIIHYGQIVNSGKFRQYDYGSIENQVRYGQITPKDYNLSSATAPIAIYYSKNDDLSTLNDVEKLSGILPNVVLKRIIKDDLYTHINFIMAIDIVELLYNEVIAMMEVYSKII